MYKSLNVYLSDTRTVWYSRLDGAVGPGGAGVGPGGAGVGPGGGGVSGLGGVGGFGVPIEIRK